MKTFKVEYSSTECMEVQAETPEQAFAIAKDSGPESHYVVENNWQVFDGDEDVTPEAF